MLKSQSKKKGNIPKSTKISDKTVAIPKVEIERQLVKRGFARKGELIAVIHPPVLGRDGKNVLGEPISAKKVDVPRLIAGRNVKVEKGTSYFIVVDGMVEVQKDDRGNYYIHGKLYRYGSFSIDLSDDEMAAFLTVVPPVGGARPVTAQEVLDQCGVMGISVGLNETAVKRTVNEANEQKRTIDSVTIAQGEEPIHGEDASFEYRVRLASGSRFEIREDGRTDFKEHDLITNVKKDQLIAVMKRPQEGVKDGRTVMGEVLKAVRGRDVEMGVGKNVRVEEENGIVNYYSLVDGQLLTHRNTLTVEPVMVVKGDVGPKTGNIDFNGFVIIHGNVNDNYRVRAGEDITVQGNVGSAYLHSGGSIVIKNGVIGKYKGLVSAEGDITLKFAENSNIQALGNIVIQRAALNCKLLAGGKVISTQEKGQVVGGEIKAKSGLEVKILGNESENNMSVQVGTDFFLETCIKDIKDKVGKYEKALSKLDLLLDKLRREEELQGELPDRLKTVHSEARKKSTIIKLAIDNLQKKERDCLVKLNEIEDSEVVVSENLHKGVKIQFGAASYEPEATKRAVKVYYNRKYRKVDIARL
jgi:uncharacterized protein (DUF342 family)